MPEQPGGEDSGISNVNGDLEHSPSELKCGSRLSIGESHGKNPDVEWQEELEDEASASSAHTIVHFLFRRRLRLERLGFSVAETGILSV